MSQKPPGLFDRFKPTANALQNALRGPRKFQGTGQSLGGGSAHISVVSVQLNDAGSLGMGIEKTQSGGCIVSRVEPGSQAEQAGVVRGDVVCFAGSEGTEEVEYKLFLEMAKAAQRPLCFELRRVGGSATTMKANGIGTGAATISSASTASTSSSRGPATTKQSAEAFARKQAVVAAAEARDKANKAKLKPISRIKDPAAVAAASNASDNKYELPSNDPKSEVAKAAIAEAKRQEAVLAAQLGYNPYEPNTATAGQARNAATTAQAPHGGTTDQLRTINAAATPPASVPPPLREAPPQEPVRVAAAASIPLPLDVEDALALLVSTSAAHPSAISTLRKLVVNATTKGRDPTAADATKFRRVRLSNPKVSAAIVDPPGAFDLMLSFGFILTEEEGESWLVYPAADADTPIPEWLPEALERLQHACEQ